MAQALYEVPQSMAKRARVVQESERIIARAKLRRLLELEAGFQRGVLDSSAKRERLQLRSTLRELDKESYLEYLQKRDEQPEDVRPTGVRLDNDVRDSSRKLALELQEARKKLTRLGRRKRRIESLRLRSPSTSSPSLDDLDLELGQIVAFIDGLQRWLVSIGIYDEILAEIRYLYRLLERWVERRDAADQIRASRRIEGLPWPRHWESEYQRILVEIRRIEHRLSQKKILIARSRSGGWF